jgi:hypothetical protein
MYYGGIDVHLAIALIFGTLGFCFGVIAFALLAAHCGALGR